MTVCAGLLQKIASILVRPSQTPLKINFKTVVVVNKYKYWTIIV